MLAMILGIGSLPIETLGELEGQGSRWPILPKNTIEWQAGHYDTQTLFSHSIVRGRIK